MYRPCSPVLLTLLVAATTAGAQDAPGTRAAVGPVEVRLEAALAACEAADQAGLSLAATDASAPVRQAAAHCWNPALYGLEPLVPLARDPDPSVRLTATERLASASQAAAREALRERLADPDAGVRAAAVRALGAQASEAALIAPLLADADPIVAAAAARALSDSAVPLTAEQQELLHARLVLADLLDATPEAAWGLAELVRRQDALADFLSDRPDDPAGCRNSALAALSGTDTPLDRLLAGADKLGLGLQAVSNALDEVGDQQRRYEACLASTPLVFGERGASLLEDTISMRAAVDSTWFVHFGRLRSDLARAQGGEHWTQADLGLELLWPPRPEGFLPDPGMPGLDVSAHLRRNQLFRNEELSGWAGGGLVDGRLPFGCGQFEYCLARAGALAEHSAGRDADYLDQLVAAHQRYLADASLHVPLGRLGVVVGADVGRLQYPLDRLQPAEHDWARFRFELDSRFQLQVQGTRNIFPHSGLIAGGPERRPGTLRDGWIVDTLLGVRFGQEDPHNTLLLVVLGGVALPVMDDPRLDLDPQVLFQSALTAQTGVIDGDLMRFRILGGRRLIASPRDFALQRVTETLLDFTYQGVGSLDSGIRVTIGLGYDLVQHDLPLGTLSELDTHLLEGGFDLRVLAERWLGFAVSNYTGGLRHGAEGDFEVTNRFLVSLFVPIGTYRFGLEEARPW